MGGATPVTFVDGLLSGLAHPLIEPPHLAALLLTGVVAARLARPAWIALFVGGSFLGTGALGLRFPLPLGETSVTASPLLLAVVLLVRSPAADRAAAIALLLVGVVHGMAFAEAIVGAEATPLAAYLLGLAGIEGAVAGATAAVVLAVFGARPQRKARLFAG
jgi:urease accessory protein